MKVDDLAKKMKKVKNRKKGKKNKIESNLKLNSINLKEKLLEKLKVSQCTTKTGKTVDENDSTLKQLVLNNSNFQNFSKLKTQRRKKALINIKLASIRNKSKITDFFRKQDSN